MQKLLYCLCLFFCPFFSKGEEPRFRISFYNLENFFDCEDDTEKEDEDFLPTSIRHWTSYRMYEKANHISQVITGIGEWEAPALIGICEIENENAVQVLTQKSTLKRQGYKYIITKCNDVRGINVALLYRPDLFRLLSSKSHPITFPDSTFRPTRDILHVTGINKRRDTLDILVCHLPSKVRKNSKEAQRISLLQLKTIIDSLSKHRNTMRLVVMGDFNTSINDPVLSKILSLKDHFSKISSKELYSLFPSYKAHQSQGSYKYKGEWELIDHMYISGQWLHESENTEAHVYSAPYLLERDKTFGGKKPFRTWNGMKYQSGYSDHLPIYVDLK